MSSDIFPAMKLWSQEYLCSKITHDISVNITPNGLGDAVIGSSIFVKPKEEKMPLREFFNIMDPAFDSDFSGIPYISHQNDSLREQFSEILKDVPSSIRVAEDVFGNAPDAINLWIGDQRSITTVHKGMLLNSDDFLNILAFSR
jgi:jumonji domain-containing protein 7